MDRDDGVDGENNEERPKIVSRALMQTRGTSAMTSVGRSIAKESPLLSMLSRTIKDQKGRTVAEIGPLASDVDGQLVTQISNNLSLATIWLRETMARAFSAKQLSAELCLNFLMASPLFEANRRPILPVGGLRLQLAAPKCELAANASPS